MRGTRDERLWEASPLDRLTLALALSYSVRSPWSSAASCSSLRRGASLAQGLRRGRRSERGERRETANKSREKE